MQKGLAAILVAAALAVGFSTNASAQARGCEPEKVAQKYPTLAGKPVRVATTPFYAPYEYADPSSPDKLIGSDIEINEAALACVGLKVEYLKGVFSSLMATLTSNQTDAMVANLYYNPDRGKVVDFITYMKAGTALIVPKGNPKKIRSLDDVCGLNTTGTISSASLKVLEETKQKCVAAGKADLTIAVAPESDAAYRGISNGRADFMLDNAGGAAVRLTAEPNAFDIAVTTTQETLVGIAVVKGNDALARAYAEGIKRVQDDGTMAKIFTKYKLDPTLISPAQIIK